MSAWRVVGTTCAVLVAGGALAACGGSGAPRTVATPAPVVESAPASLSPACSRLARRGRRSLVRCPSVLPPGTFAAPRAYDVTRCSYLLDLEPRSGADDEGSHVLVGGRCGPWPLGLHEGGWPVDPALRHDLRLVGRRPLRPGGGGGETVRLRALRRTTVRSAAALLVRSPPHPTGGIHGDHVGLLWNEGGAGYVVSVHVPAAASPGALLPVLRTVASTMLPVG